MTPVIVWHPCLLCRHFSLEPANTMRIPSPTSAIMTASVTAAGSSSAKSQASASASAPSLTTSTSTSTSTTYALRGPPPSTTLSSTIKSQFQRCRTEQILRNDPLASDVLRRRIVPGKFGLVTEHEPSLFALKRPATISHRVDMDEGFSSEKFHFNRVKGTGEVLAVIHDGDEQTHRVLVNVSPLMEGHGLLIPFAEQCLPQQLTAEAIDLAVRVLRRDIDHQANSGEQTIPPADKFCIGFNSLGAFSSVNHLHLHILYPAELDHEARGERLFPHGRGNFPIAYAAVKRRVTSNYHGMDVSVEELNWAVPCFSFQPNGKNDNGDDCLSKAVSSFVRYLHHKRIPHNVLFIQEEDTNTIRCIIIPRQHQDHFDKDKHGFNAALGEISGMLIARTKEHFDAFMEKDIVRQMQLYVACGEGELESIYAELKR